MPQNSKPTALDAAFVIGSTLIGTRAIARALGLSAVVGTRVTIAAAVLSTTGAGGATARRVSSALFAPANRARLALEGITLPSRLIAAEGSADDGTERAAES